MLDDLSYPLAGQCPRAPEADAAGAGLPVPAGSAPQVVSVPPRLPPGWRLTAEGAWVRVCQPRMTRRRKDWDYTAPATYQITLVLADRGSRALGVIVVDAADAAGLPIAAHCELSPLGKAVADCWESIPHYHPECRILGKMVMDEHFHGIIRVERQMRCHLSEVINGFITGCRRAGVHFAKGFNDKMIFSLEELQHRLAYLASNPIRRAVKMARPELFQVCRDLTVKGLHFAAIGNHYLLEQPLAQLQCSRHDFAYRRVRDARGRLQLVKDAEGNPQIEHTSPAYAERLEAMLAAAEEGRVLISPCLSDGERQLAREAYARHLPLITLQNMGFSPLYKPGGRLFTRCADGLLLMLAPIAWPYQNTPRTLVREDACALNRIAQLIAGEGAVEINYHGMRPVNIAAHVAEICRARGALPAST